MGGTWHALCRFTNKCLMEYSLHSTTVFIYLSSFHHQLFEAMLLKSCLPCTGYVIRMEDHRIPKQLLFGELDRGHRRQGRPCKHFKDTMKAGLKLCGIPPTELVATYTICVMCAEGRASPPSTVHQTTPQLSSVYPSDNCELPVPSLCTALQVQDRPAEPLLYPQIEAQAMPPSRPRDHHYDDDPVFINTYKRASFFSTTNFQIKAV